MATTKPTRPNVVAGNGHAPAARKSVVEEGTTFKGSISGNAPVLVRGVFEGEITGAAVDIDRNGVLLGKAKVSDLRCRGELAGEFEAENAEIGGHVRDKTIIRARSLLVVAAGAQDADGSTDGSTMFGECQIEVGDPPSKEQALQQALGQSRAPAASPVPPRAAPPVPPPARTTATLPPAPPPVPEPRAS